MRYVRKAAESREPVDAREVGAQWLTGKDPAADHDVGDKADHRHKDQKGCHDLETRGDHPARRRQHPPRLQHHVRIEAQTASQGLLEQFNEPCAADAQRL
jgi:hypothetical protein